MKRFLAFSLLTLSTSCWGDQSKSFSATTTMPEPKLPSPWFTGPLLTPAPNVVPGGHYNIEPYVYYGTTTARYGSNWSTISVPKFSQARIQVPIQVGLTSWMDITVTPQVLHSWSQGAASTKFTDFPVQLDFQLLHDRPGMNWHPSIKLAVKEIFPTGKYQNLNPNKHKTDISGSGSFATSIGLDFGKQFHFTGVHWLSTRFAMSYAYPAPVHVRGFNTYGGGYGTAGKVHPGNIYNMLLGLEYSMTRRWVAALDVACTLTSKTRFSGTPGMLTPLVPARVGSTPSDPLGLAGSSEAVTGGPASARFSLAPALEYNWNANLGIIGGAIFSVAGRNAIRIATGSIALNYYY